MLDGSSRAATIAFNPPEILRPPTVLVSWFCSS
jgi:hypothetical protein